MTKSKAPQLDKLGFMPPQDNEMEQAVLGAIIQEKMALRLANSIIKDPEIFYYDAHQRIYSAIMNLEKQYKDVDSLTVIDELRKMGNLELIGGAYYIATLTGMVNSSAHLEQHIRIITEMWMKRTMIRLSSDMEKASFDPTEDAFDIVAQAQAHLQKILETLSTQSIKLGKELVNKALADIGKAMNNTDGITGVASGLTEVDKVTGGWQNSDLIIVAARPGMGKTSFALQCYLNAVLHYNKKGLFFSLEMGAEQLTKKMMASVADFSTSQIVKGNINEDQFKHLNTKAQILYRDEIAIDDTASIKIQQMRAKAISHKMKYGLDFIIVDYLQLMSGEDKKGGREQEVSSISRGLKMLAKELSIPVIALSQLSRAVEATPDKRPMLSHLRESGAIEQDADMVIFLYRPEYYKISEWSNGSSTVDTCEIIIAKHRNGGLDNPIVGCKMKYSQMFDQPSDTFKPLGQSEDLPEKNMDALFNHRPDVF